MPKRLTDDDLLNIVRNERRRSIGFGQDEELTDQRIKALEYLKGEMRDVPFLPNRSAAVSTDIADAVATVFPDLVDIFTSGDDDFAFRAISEKDVDQAAQETDYVNQVVFRDNDGFLILASIIKDALEMKTGVARWVWEDRDPQVEAFEGKTAIEAMAAIQDGGDPSDGKVTPDPDTGELLYSFTLTKKQPGRVMIYTYPPVVSQFEIHRR